MYSVLFSMYISDKPKVKNTTANLKHNQTDGFFISEFSFDGPTPE